FVRDEAGAIARYSNRIEGDLISTTIEVDGNSYRVEGTVDTYKNELLKALKEVQLPQLRRILRFTDQAKTNSQFRIRLGLPTVDLVSSDCTIACEVAADTAGSGIGLFAAGYCAACIVHDL